jgi:ligand-binding sensor domain-containing protein
MRSPGFHWYILLFFLQINYSGIPQKNINQEMEGIQFDRLFSENIKFVKGLSQNWIYAIHQDQYGYMWFGTWEGLNKYDGYNYTIYNVQDGLSDHTIHCILEDDEGFLWLGTNKGLNKFDRKKQVFTQYTNLPGDTSSLFYNQIQALIQTRDGRLWLGTGAGLYEFNKNTEKFTAYLGTGQEYYSPRSNYILHLLEDKKGIIWVSTTFGLVKFDPKTKRSARYYQVPGDSTSLSHNNVRCVFQEKSGNFWIGTRRGLNYFDTTNQTIRQFFSDKNDPYSISDDWIRVIYEDRMGQVWIGTEEGGLNLYDKTTNRFIHFQNALNNKNSLSNNKVYSIYEDYTGNLWVGTYNGVNKIDKYYNNFEHRQRTSNDNRSLNDNIIWAFEEDDKNNLWIGTSSGVNMMDKSTGHFEYLTYDPGNPASLSSNEIRAILYTPEYNCVWFCNWGAGLDKYDLKSKTVFHFKLDPVKTSFSDDYVNDIIKAKDGIIWVATGRGLNRLDPLTGNIENFHHSAEINSISHDIAICLFEDSHDNIWIGTNDGLNKFNVAQKVFTRYRNVPGNQKSLSHNTIFCINEDRKGNIWIGTSGGGLNRFDPVTEQFYSFTTLNGLPNNIVYGILEDDNGNIWVSTNLGLSKIYVDNWRIVNYDVKDGIQSNEFNLGAYYAGKDGKLYFGGMNGYNVFDPSKIKYNPNKPVTVISAFRKFNEIQSYEYSDGDTIKLLYDDNFFSLEFSALDYTNPSKNRYRYRLQNVDKDWIQTDAGNRLAEYRKVRPGTYVFNAVGSNNDGVWDEKGVSLVIIITPPWWSNWWFRILLSIFLIALVSTLIYRRIRGIRKKSEIEQKLLEIEKQKFELEQKALRLQMNPHFIFNSLNSIQSYILSNDAEKAVLYLGKFSQLMRLILSNSANKFISLKEELKSIIYYLDLEKLRFENKFDYTISLDKDMDNDFIEIPPMIVQPYIENAIIHGLLHKPTKGKIDIAFKHDGEKLICTVTDDGVGRERSMEIAKNSGIVRKSRGMLITQARLEILNRQSKDEFSVKVTDLKDEAGNPTGTKIELIFHFKEEL